MQSQVTIKTLYKMKNKGEKIVALTAYDFPFAKMIEESGVHLILVGDSFIIPVLYPKLAGRRWW